MSTFPMNKQQDFIGGLLSFLQSPEAKGLSAGLLQASAPSMTQPNSFGGALGFGLQNAQKFAEADQKRKLAEKVFGLDQSRLGLEQGRFGLEQQKYARELQMQRELMDLINGYSGGASSNKAPLPNEVAVAQDALAFNEPPASNTPGSEEEIIVVTHPQLNNGQPTKIPATLNGRALSEKEAIDIALANKETDQVLGTQNGALNKEGSPQTAPGAGGLLANQSPADAQRKAILARGLLLAGDKTGALKTLFKDEEQNLTGLPQEYASLESLKARFGENSPTYKDAKRALDTRLSSQEQMSKYREKMLETADKRYSTKLGKYQAEINDINAGFMPGTGRTMPLESEEQQMALLDKYNLQVQKDISDQDTRKRALFASNIDKTIEQIDVDALTQYAGATGVGKKTIEELKASVGKESPEYDRYVESLAAAETLAMQIRQFYGESITPTTKKAIEDLVNPATWKNNPALAKRQFQKIVDILENETGTFRGGLQGVGEFRKQESKGAQDMVTIRNPKTGETKRVTREEAENLTRKK